MTVVARIKKDGSLLLANDVNERLPVVVDGLVAYYPFDGEFNNAKPDVYVSYVNYTVNTIDQRLISYAANSPFIFTCTFKPAWDCADDKFIISLQNGDVASNVFNYGVYTGKLLTWTVTPDTGAVITQGVSHHLKLDYDGTTLKIYLDGALVNSRAVSIAAATYIRVGEYSNTATGDAWIGELSNWTFTQKYQATNNSNTIQTPDGVAVQEATTNIYSTNLNDAYDWLNSGISPIISNDDHLLTKPVKDDLVKIRSFYSTGDIGGYHFGFVPIGTSVSTQYTLSIWYYQDRVNNGTLPYARGGVSNSNLGYLKWIENNSTDANTWAVKKWIRLAVTFTTNGTETSVYLSQYPGTYCKIGMCAPQLEAKSYPTAFVNGSKSGGYLSIPNPVKTGNYTVNFKCNIPTNVGTVSGYQTIMSMGDYYTTNSWTIMDSGGGAVNGWQSLIRKGAGNEWAWGGGFTDNNNFHNNNIFTLVRNATDYLTYFNGVYTGIVAHLSTTMQDLIWIGSRQYGGSELSSNISELSIYNRALSATEIKALAGEGFKTTTTKATTPLLIESPVIPLDGYYFPLASDTKDSSKTVDAITKTNVVFEDGSAWVGTSVSNISPNSTNLAVASGWNYNQASIASIDNATPIDSLKSSYKINFTTIPWDLYKQYSVTSGLSYTFSIYVKLGTATNFCVVVNNTSAWNTVTHKEFTAADGLSTTRYKKISLTFTAPSTNVINVHLGAHSDTMTQQTAGTIYLYGHQLYQTVFLPSFMQTGSRGATALTYNLNSTIGLDWSGNWTICYWKKPVGTHDSTLTGYNIDSLGCNSNSVGGGYAYWGKNAGTNNMGYYADGSAQLNSGWGSYFNNWQFVVVQKTGTTMRFKFIGLDYVYDNTLTVPTTPSNRYVNQYGYDLKLGGWDNGSPCNAYYRDLIVVKRALSDAELTNIYKQFSIHKTYVNTDNLIEEGI